MLATLLVGTALAGPPQLGLALGPVVGGGTSTYGDYFSAAPATAVTVTWHLGPFETWVGASGSLLLAGSGDDVVPASLLQGEVGVGLGGRALGAGIYGGNGLPGPIVGLYARGTVPGRGWVRRMGLEARLFGTQATATSGFALLVRVEPGRGRPERPPVEVVEAPPAEADVAPVAEVPPEAPVEPAETPPAPAEDADTPTTTHHDEPW